MGSEPEACCLGDVVGAVHVGVDGVVTQLALVLVVLGLGGGDLRLGVGDLLVEPVERDLGRIGRLGVALDREVQIVDLGGDRVGLSLFVLDGVCPSGLG